MGKKKRGVSAKKSRSKTLVEPAEIVTAPHSFVIHHGKVGRHIRQLERDLRQVMEPYTAAKLKVGKRNVLKDFVAVSGLLHVSHLVVFTRTEISAYLHLVRLPRGPSLTFRIINFTLAKDVISSLKKPATGFYRHFPLAVLNSFASERVDLKLMASMFQNMFPAINVNKVSLNDIRRCVLFNYNEEDKTIDIRHYAIKVVPHGLSKAVKKLMQNKVPDLSRFQDISEFVLKSGMLSDSEVEPDGPENQIILPQKITSRGNMVNQQSAIRLVELGPRLTLQLVKIEEGVMQGEVLFHDLVHKSMEEVRKNQEKKRQKQTLKRERQKQQEANKVKKLEEKEKHKERSLEGMKDSVNPGTERKGKDGESVGAPDSKRKEFGSKKRGEEGESGAKRRKKEETPLDKIMKLRAKRKKLKDKVKSRNLKVRRIVANKTHAKVQTGKLAMKKQILKKRRK